MTSTGFIWLTIWSNGSFLRPGQLNFGFHKNWHFSTVRFSRTTSYRGFLKLVFFSERKKTLLRKVQYAVSSDSGRIIQVSHATRDLSLRDSAVARFYLKNRCVMREVDVKTDEIRAAYRWLLLAQPCFFLYSYWPWCVSSGILFCTLHCQGHGNSWIYITNHKERI
jgi:hypothetical protein